LEDIEVTRFDLLKMYPMASESFIAVNADSPAPVRKKNTSAVSPLLPQTNPVAASCVAKNGTSDKVDNGCSSLGVVPETRSTIKFTIPVVPRSVQFGKRMGLNKRTGRMLMFCDKKTKAFYEAISEAARPFTPTEPLQGPLRVTMDMFFPRPKRLMTKSSPTEAIWKPSTPDAENCFKGISDPLTKERFWEDDCQIVDQRARKFYCAKADEAHITITIEPL